MIYLYLKDGAFTAVKRDAKGIIERGVLSIEGIQNGHLLLSRIVYKKGEGWISGTSF